MTAYEFYTEVFGLKNEQNIQNLVDVTEYRYLKKGEYLVRVGEVLNDVCFLESGILRGYFIDVNGKEVTDCFCFQSGSPAMTFSKLEENVQSKMTIQMIQPSGFFCVPISKLLTLIEDSTELLMLYNRFLTTALDVHWKMKQVLHQYSAAQRYQWFLEEYPDLIAQVSNKYIASFLGMTPVTLSRLRKEIREGGGKVTESL